MALESGQLFAGDFRIERELSQGGMGRVYVATQLSTGRQRALKVMRPELVADPSMRRRFEQEARVGAGIKSDHVVEVVAAGVDEPTKMPWLAMELLEGESLAELVTRKDGLPAAEASELLDQLAHALTAAHAAGVVHRDLKPENVFVARARRASERATVKVLDFGIAKVVAEARATATAPLGTLFWMAPEQADADGVIGPATDVWAFGLIAFDALVGRPFWDESASVPVLVKKITVDAIPPASERARAIGRQARLPAGFDAWLARCVARAPGDRFASIAAASDALKVLLGASSISTAPTQRADLLVAATAAESAPTQVAPAPTPSAAGSAQAAAASSPAAAAPAQVAAASSPAASGARGRPTGIAWAAMALAVVAGAALIVRARVAQAPAGTGAIASGSAPVASASAAPVASGSPSTGKLKLYDDDDEDHDTVFRVPVGDSPRRGAAHPLLTVVEFADFQCPYAHGYEDRLQELLATYPDDVAVVWKDLPLAFHPIAGPAARLARLARAELGDDGFWRAHDLLFTACTNNDREQLLRVGRELGLPAAKVRAALDPTDSHAFDADIDLSMDLGGMGTPTSFFNGRQVSGSQTLEHLHPIIDHELTKARALLASGVPRERVYDELQKGAVARRDPERLKVDIPRSGPVIAGAHAVLDVHLIGDETSVFTGLRQPTVDYLLREYGDRIRLYWHFAPDPANETAMRVASFAHRVYVQNGSDIFWKLHRMLVQNEEWPFPDATRPKSRGYGEDVLVDFARRAGANPLYLQEGALNPRDEHDDWAALRKMLEDAEANSMGVLCCEGYTLGTTVHGTKRIVDQLLAGK